MKQQNQAGISASRYRIVQRRVPVPAPPGWPAAAQALSPAVKRDYKKIVGAVFLTVLFLLIFFSKTIYSYNLPAVTAVNPENGRLSKLEMSTGIANFAEVETIYAAAGGKVEEVCVKEGDKVSKGQALYRLSFDREEADRKLREIQNSRSRLYNDIQGINLKLEKLKRYMNDLSGETYEDEASSYELDALAIDIREARAELEAVRERYDEDEATELEVDKARYNLQSLYLKRDELERKAKETIAEQEKDRETRQKDYESDIAALELDLKAKQIDLNNLVLQEEPYQKALADFETYATIAAPEDGTVVSLPVQKGEAIHEEQLLASIGAGGAFEIACDLSLDNNFVIAGDSVELSNASHALEGTVVKVTPAAQGKTVTIAVNSDGITAGETFDITFQKDSDTTYVLVPNGALNQDNDGYFLNQIKRRDGILGEEYYLERLDVYIGNSDSENTAILQGITFFEPIALISDQPIAPGDVISVSNVGDFFEK